MKKIKILLSCAIVFHLLMILTIPNGNSYFIYAWEKVLFPYTSTLNIGYAWQFFSPDPAAAIYYEISPRQGGKPFALAFYPDDEQRPFFHPNYSRRNSIKNVFMKFPNFTAQVLTPYFCRQFPQAQMIFIRKKVIRPVTYEEALHGRALNDTSLASYEDVGEEFCENP